jgi:hypothetical protein
MELSFNSQGFLHRTITLTYEEFKHFFGTNQLRIQHINNALQFFRIFYSCGCSTVYIGGSFVSKKREPEDIDLCFDLSNIEEGKIKETFPEFFDINKRGRIRRDQKCHLFHFDIEDHELLDFLNKDRDGNQIGLVKLALNEINNYDKKSKTI